MAILGTKYQAYGQLKLAGASGSRKELYLMEEGVLGSERSRDATTYYNLNDTNPGDYLEWQVPVPAGTAIPASSVFEVSFRGKGTDAGGSTTCTPKLVIDGTTTYTAASTVTFAYNTESTQTQTITVSSNEIVDSALVLRLYNTSRDANIYPFHDGCYIGVSSGDGISRTTAVYEIISPGAGTHESPTTVMGPPAFTVRGDYIYPDDSLRISKYTDTATTAAHSVSAESEQTVGVAADYTTSFSGVSERVIDITADATRKPDALTPTYYELEAKQGATVIIATPMHAYLGVSRPTLTTLNGAVEGAPVTTTEVVPWLRWVNPNNTADRFQVQVYDTDDAEVYDSTEQVSTATEWQIPAGEVTSLTTHYAVVTVRDGTDWEVPSLPGYFQIDDTTTAVKITSHQGTVDAVETITTRAPTIEWSFAKTQSAFCVTVVDNADDTNAYTSGWTSSATKSHALPANTLDLGATYSIQVQVQDTLFITYTADERAWVHVNESSIAAPALTAEGDTTTAVAVTLAWTAPAVGDGDSLTYELELNSSATGSAVYIVGTPISYYLGKLSADTYTWRVRATDEHGLAGTWSGLDTFVISQAGSVPTVSLVPWGPSTDTTPLHAWTYYDADGQVQDAYEVEVDDTDDSFGSLVVDTGTVASALPYYQQTFALTAGNTYYRRVRVRSATTDWSDWVDDTISILAPVAQSDDFELWRDMSGTPTQVTQAVSGLWANRRLDGPSEFGFTIDNFDGLEGAIADDDELELKLKDTDGNALVFHGYVTQKSVGDLCEVTCADISDRFDRWAVTVTMNQATLGQVITAIVQNPTSLAATGVTALVDEVDDPDNPGYPIMIETFEGQARSARSWLDEFAKLSGCRWYLYYESGWRFRWFNPATAAAWATTLRDDIDADQTTRQNVLLQSAEFDATWTASQVTVDDQATTDPLGTSLADKIQCSVVDGGHYVAQGPTLADTTDYVVSVYAKAAELDGLAMYLAVKDGTVYQQNYDLSAGTVEGNGANEAPDWATVLDAGDGWWRCSMKAGSASGATTPALRLYPADGEDISFAGSGTNGVYLWGAMMHAGVVPRPYVGTTTAAVSQSVLRVITTPKAERNRRRYINRVRFHSTQMGPPLPASVSDYDAYVTDATTGWTAWGDYTTVSTDAVDKLAGTAAVEVVWETTATGGPVQFGGSIGGAQGSDITFLNHYQKLALFTLPPAWQDWVGTPYWDEITFQVKVTSERDGTPDPENWPIIGAVLPAYALFNGKRDYTSSADGVHLPILHPSMATLTDPSYPLGQWNQIRYRLAYPRMVLGDRQQEGYVVGALAFMLQVLGTGPSGAFLVPENSTQTFTVLLDAINIKGQKAATPQGHEFFVETAPVTAGTEVPIEEQLSDVALPGKTAASLARQRLALTNKTHVTVGDVQLHGIVNVPLTRKLPVYLSTVNIDTNLPIAEVQYRPLDAGHTTTLVLGDMPTDAVRGIEALVQSAQRTSMGLAAG